MKHIRYSTLFLTLFLIAFAVPVTWAAEDTTTAESVTIYEDEVVNDDLYLGTGSLTIDGEINGDVFVFANEVIVNGIIRGDLFAGAGQVTINGEVTDDVRVGTQRLLLGSDAKIGSDLLLGGQGFIAEEGSFVGGDVKFGAALTSFNGTVEGDIQGGGTSVEINGTVGGSVDLDFGDPSASAQSNQTFNKWIDRVGGDNYTVDLPDISSGLTLGDSASIGGDLEFASTSDIEIDEGVVAGEIAFSENAIVDKDGNKLTGAKLWIAQAASGLQSWLTLLAAGIFLLWVAPRLVTGSAHQLQKRSIFHILLSILWGFLFIIFVPIILLIAIGLLIALGVFVAQFIGEFAMAVVILPIMLLLLCGALYLFTLALLSKLAIGYWIGRGIFRKTKSRWLPLAVGLFVVALLTAIPFYVGGVISFLLSLIGLSAVIFELVGRLTNRNGTTTTRTQAVTTQVQEEKETIEEFKPLTRDQLDNIR